MNWWLMALAFALGLLLTGSFLIRRVTREVPVYESGGAATARLVGEKPKADTPEVDAVPKLAPGATAATASAAAASKFTVSSGAVPYGAGSFRGTAAPLGYGIKGNEDSMLYHPTDSPSYAQTVAEVWFDEESSAKRAGFTRWDEGRTGAPSGAASFADVPPGPHGPGSAKPHNGGAGPEGWEIKGNEDSKLYYSPESPSYRVTIAEIWFRDVETAEAAGFHRWDSGKSQRGKD